MEALVSASSIRTTIINEPAHTGVGLREDKISSFLAMICAIHVQALRPCHSLL